jgi:DNA-binding GntR family transcriptional regulator
MAKAMRSPKLAKLSPRPLRAGVIEQVRGAILDGRLPAGAPLVEARIAEELGVSRAPVREAVRMLEEEGLVVSIPYRGAFVTDVTPETILEIVDARSVLEAFAAERALPRLREDGIRRLRELYRLMDQAADADDPAGLIEHHLAFHRTIYELASHGLMLDFWLSMESKLRMYLRVNLRTFESLKGVVRGHQQTLRAIESGEAARIKREVVAHIHQNVEQLVGGARAHGEDRAQAASKAPRARPTRRPRKAKSKTKS